MRNDFGLCGAVPADGTTYNIMDGMLVDVYMADTGGSDQDGRYEAGCRGAD